MQTISFSAFLLHMGVVVVRQLVHTLLEDEALLFDVVWFFFLRSAPLVASDLGDDDPFCKNTQSLTLYILIISLFCVGVLCVLVAKWLAFGTASLMARVRSCGREAYKRLDSSAHTL